MSKLREVHYDDQGRPRVDVSGRLRLAEQKECWQCGNMFWRPINNGRPHKFCSIECRGKNGLKVWAQRRVMKRCSICYTFFKVQRSKSNRYVTCGQPTCRKERKRQVALRRHAEAGQRLFHK